MNPPSIGAIVFACALGGALLGMWLRTALPEHHVNAESRDAVKVSIGLIATMTALVLGIVTASAKGSFETVNTAVKNTAMDILTLDRLLARYGPETGEIRAGLQRAVGARVETIWGASRSSEPSSPGPAVGEELANRIRALTPRDDSQRALQSRALDAAETLLRNRWIFSADSGTSVPLPFLVVLLFWLTITFASFGLFAPRNAIVVAALTVCAMSVGSAVFLILEMDGPFDGLLKVSAEPLRYAVANMNQ